MMWEILIKEFQKLTYYLGINDFENIMEQFFHYLSNKLKYIQKKERGILFISTFYIDKIYFIQRLGVSHILVLVQLISIR